MLNVVYDHFLTRKPPFFTLFILSRTSDNTASQNIGGDNAWAVPHLKFWGGPSPPVPLGLRPWAQDISLLLKLAHNLPAILGHKHLRGHPFMTSTRRGGEGVRLRWTHVDGGGGAAPCGRPHRKLKLESTDVILSSSRAKKLAFFYQNFVFGQKKVEIFLRYKLVI